MPFWKCLASLLYHQTNVNLCALLSSHDAPFAVHFINFLSLQSTELKLLFASRGHPGTKPFMCREPDCGRTFECPSLLHEHTSESRHMMLTKSKKHRVPAQLQAPQQQHQANNNGNGCTCVKCPHSFPDFWTLMEHQDTEHMGLVPLSQVAHVFSLANDAVWNKSATAATGQLPSQRSQPTAFVTTTTSLPPGSYTTSFVPTSSTSFAGTYGPTPSPYPLQNSFPPSFIPPAASSHPSIPLSYTQMHPAFSTGAPPPYQPPAHAQQHAQMPLYYNPHDHV